MKRIFMRLFLVIFFAMDFALAIVLWRSPDPMYRAQELLAMGRYHEFDDLIVKAARKHGLDPLLVKAVVWRESRFQPEKVGAAGERGLMQVGEAAARDWAAAQKIEVFVYADLFDAKTNIEAGAWYLSRALEHWKDRDFPVYFALAEYNAGRSRVERWAANSLSGEVMLRASGRGGTHGYVDDIMHRFHIYRDHRW